MYKEGFSIITVTNRDYCIENMINNFLRQNLKTKELIIVINNDNIDTEHIYKYINQSLNIHIYKLPENKPLGSCLNYAIEKSSYNTIAKFDDDDYYGPYYLDEAKHTFLKEGCSILGKQRTYYYLEKYKKLILKKNAIENDYVKSLMGSTLCFKKDVFDKVKFEDISIREDYYFNKKCIKNGYKLYSTSKYNHLVFKHADINKHTFKSNIHTLINLCSDIKSNIKYEDCFNIINNKDILI
ncbi:MAG: glycosyltransferase [Clostridium sp.]|nr:glycosyltransferase [Clostridium sp.]